MPGYVWNNERQEYRTAASGATIPDRRIEDALNLVTVKGEIRMRMLAQDLSDRKIDVQTWKSRMRDEIKYLHQVAAATAHGGWANMGNRELGALGARLAHQYRYLNRFSAQLQFGGQPMNGRFVVRAQMYARAAYSTYTGAKMTQRETWAGQHGRVLLARRLLGGVETEHCEGCQREADRTRKWVDAETISPIGSQRCMANCRCRIEYKLGKREDINEDAANYRLSDFDAGDVRRVMERVMEHGEDRKLLREKLKATGERDRDIARTLSQEGLIQRAVINNRAFYWYDAGKTDPARVAAILAGEAPAAPPVLPPLTPPAEPRVVPPVVPQTPSSRFGAPAPVGSTVLSVQGGLAVTVAKAGVPTIPSGGFATVGEAFNYLRALGVRDVVLDVGELQQRRTPDGRKAELKARALMLSTLAAETFYEMSALGLPVPPNLLIGDTRHFNGAHVNASYNGSERTFKLNLYADQWKDYSRLVRVREGQARSGEKADPHPRGTLRHEYGHFLHQAINRAKYDLTRDQKLTGEEKTLISREVSRYAATNRRETVAEVYTGLMYGKRYGFEVMSRYIAWGGVIPSHVAIAAEFEQYRFRPAGTPQAPVSPQAPTPLPPALPPVVLAPPVAPPSEPVLPSNVKLTDAQKALLLVMIAQHSKDKPIARSTKNFKEIDALYKKGLILKEKTGGRTYFYARPDLSTNAPALPPPAVVALTPPAVAPGAIPADLEFPKGFYSDRQYRDALAMLRERKRYDISFDSDGKAQLYTSLFNQLARAGLVRKVGAAPGYDSAFEFDQALFDETYNRQQGRDAVAAAPFPGPFMTKTAAVEYIRSLGVKFVTLDSPSSKDEGDPLVIANQFAEVLREMRLMGYAAPVSFEASSALFDNKSDSQTLAAFWSAHERIAGNLKKDYFKSQESTRSSQRMMHKSGFQSGDHRLHVMRHEYGHFQHFKQNPTRYTALRSKKFTPKEKRLVSQHVSRYAATDHYEMVAEMFAGMMQGRTYPNELMDMYAAAGGPVPKLERLNRKPGDIERNPEDVVPVSAAPVRPGREPFRYAFDKELSDFNPAFVEGVRAILAKVKESKPLDMSELPDDYHMRVAQLLASDPSSGLASKKINYRTYFYAVEPDVLPAEASRGSARTINENNEINTLLAQPAAARVTDAAAEQQQQALAREHFNDRFEVDADERARDLARRLFGRAITDDKDFGRMVGAPDGVRLFVRALESGGRKYLYISLDSGMFHPVVTGLNRRVYKDLAGQVVMENLGISLDDRAPVGFGTQLFARQVAQLSRFGISYIKTEAAGHKGDDGGTVGYYVWPRLGYDTVLTPGVRDGLARRAQRAYPKVAEALRGGQVETVQELFALPNGKEAWRDHGSTQVMSFDAASGSESRRLLSVYLRLKGLRELADEVHKPDENNDSNETADTFYEFVRSNHDERNPVARSTSNFKIIDKLYKRGLLEKVKRDGRTYFWAKESDGSIRRGKDKAGPQTPARPVMRRAPDFADSGEYEVEIDGHVFLIFRDRESAAWFLTGNTKHYIYNHLGDTKEAALDRLSALYEQKSDLLVDVKEKRQGAFVGDVKGQEDWVSEWIGINDKLRGDRAKIRDDALALGGRIAILPERPSALERKYEKLLARRGALYEAKDAILIKGGEPNACHWNASKLWKKNPEKYDIVTGLALGPDKLAWYDHTWLVDKKTGRVVEPTTDYVRYFGVRLSPSEAATFVKEMGE